jgi:hypothetical protein
LYTATRKVYRFVLLKQKVIEIVNEEELDGWDM